MKKLLVSVLLLLTMAVPSDAQLQWIPSDFFNNTGGLADGLEATATKDNEASDIQNVEFSLGGALTRRDGFDNINTSASPSATADTTGLIFWKTSAGTRFLVRVANDGGTDVIQRMDYGAGTAGPDGTWDAITGALSFAIDADDHADFTLAMDRLIIEDGLTTTAPYVWTGTGNATALTNAPNAQFVEFHKNHLVTGGNNTNPSQIAVSELCTTDVVCLTTWTATDVINIETNDGQIVRGLRSGLDALYVWKDSSIWRISGDNRDNYVREQMVKDIGTLSDQSIVVLNNRFIFTTADCDIAVYDGGLNVEIISTKIQGTIDGLNLDRCDEAVATEFDGDYLVSISNSGSSSHNLILVYDTFHQAFTKFLGMNANALATFEEGTLQRQVLFGDYDGFVHEYPETDSDNGAAIVAFYQSGWLRFPQIPQEKTFRLARVFTNQTGTGNTLTFEHRIDFLSAGTQTVLSLAGTGSLWDTAVYDTDRYADLTTLIGRVEIDRQGDFLQWYLYSSGTQPAWVVRGVQIWNEPTGRIGGS
mgnify:FL=1